MTANDAGIASDARPRVLVAMSGGVDSSVAAGLLAQQGYEVVGVTMRLWGGESDSGCCSVSDVDDARRVAQQLGIDHHVFNFGDDFDRDVVQPYVDAHSVGRTPNPCIECNRHLKFDRLLRRADALGFDLVATGHHARRVAVPGGFRIARGADASKDQSYVLYPLAGAALARTLFPLGDMVKDDVRAIARDLGLRTASKPDSQDVCFITRTQGRESFLGDRIPLRPGRVVDAAGEVIGSVDAVELVTIGQRRGLDVGGSPERRYVTNIDAATATVTMGSRDDLLADGVMIGQLVWSDAGSTDLQRLAANPGELTVQSSAHGSVVPPTTIEISSPGGEDQLRIVWESRQRKVAAGQSVVVYAGDQVLVGGIVA